MTDDNKDFCFVHVAGQLRVVCGPALYVLCVLRPKEHSCLGHTIFVAQRNEQQLKLAIAMKVSGLM